MALIVHARVSFGPHVKYVIKFKISYPALITLLRVVSVNPISFSNSNLSFSLLYSAICDSIAAETITVLLN